jgi:hypothetical protein
LSNWYLTDKAWFPTKISLNISTQRLGMAASIHCRIVAYTKKVNSYSRQGQGFYRADYMHKQQFTQVSKNSETKYTARTIARENKYQQETSCIGCKDKTYYLPWARARQAAWVASLPPAVGPCQWEEERGEGGVVVFSISRCPLFIKHGSCLEVWRLDYLISNDPHKRRPAPFFVSLRALAWSVRSWVALHRTKPCFDSGLERYARIQLFALHVDHLLIIYLSIDE